MKVSGDSDFARRNRNKFFKIKFDLQWVLVNPQWTINVTKIPKGGFEQSSIIWGQRIINFDTEDIVPIHKGNNYFQRGILHEYGHVIGNSRVAHTEVGLPARGDEYSGNSVMNGGFSNDYSSIMNLGEELRNRHLEYVLYQLNQMQSRTRFFI